MKVTVAKSAGFCFGVKRAVETVYKEIENRKEQKEFNKENNNGECNKEGWDHIYTYGPIIHNEQVVADLEKNGVTVLNSMEELLAIEHGTVIIRSHGVDRKTNDYIRERGLKLVDATCPFVKKIHKTVMEKSRDGYAILIIGNEKHPEVQGIKGWSESDTFIINTEEEAQKFEYDKSKKLCVVAQTTFNYKKFDKMVEIIGKKGYDIIVVNTICNATNERQAEARQIASGSDAMIVIGGRSSSNTQKLYEICKEECKNTYYIQKLKDLDLKKLQTCRNVGITAGASTPNNIIEEVLAECQN